MFLKLQLLTLNLTTAILLVFFLCLGSQNLNKRYSVNFLINKTVVLPIGFLIGSSFTLGIMAGGLSSVIVNNKKTNA